LNTINKLFEKISRDILNFSFPTIAVAVI
ncbi:hypothetical protein A5844_000958, partial [Enterococcus sp. 10A9_DIV0425]